MKSPSRTRTLVRYSSGIALLLLLASAAHGQVAPILDCVSYDRSQNSVTTTWGYVNTKPTNQIIPPGSSNFFTPAPGFQGQPITFHPGEFHNVFQTTFSLNTTQSQAWVVESVSRTASNDPSLDCAAYVRQFLGTSPVPSSFTYHGRLTDGNAAANGTYDLQFAIYDVAAGGTPLVSALTRPGVTVTNGVFTIQLNFDISGFSNALTNNPDRYLEISVKKPSDSSYATLAPRQQLTSTPYAIQTFNADKLGETDASQYVLTTDSRLSSTRPDYIQNTSTQQVNSNFNISGSGTIGNGLSVGGSSTINNLTVTGTLNAALPSGSANYIQNTTTQQSSSNFNSSGNGVVGETLNVTGNKTIGGTLTAISFSSNGAGLTGIFSFYSLNAVNASAPAKPSGYTFIGQTQTLTLIANQRLTGADSIPLATTSGTTPVSIGLCYSVGGGAITNFAGSAEATGIIDGTLRMQAASDRAARRRLCAVRLVRRQQLAAAFG